jgi:hypothetical protein
MYIYIYIYMMAVHQHVHGDPLRNAHTCAFTRADTHIHEPDKVLHMHALMIFSLQVNACVHVHIHACVDIHAYTCIIIYTYTTKLYTVTDTDTHTYACALPRRRPSRGVPEYPSFRWLPVLRQRPANPGSPEVHRSPIRAMYVRDFSVCEQGRAEFRFCMRWSTMRIELGVGFCSLRAACKKSKCMKAHKKNRLEVTGIFRNAHTRRTHLYVPCILF